MKEKSNGARRYPWREMKVGGTYFVACKRGEKASKVVSRLGNSLAFALPMKFSRRQGMNDGKLGVWVMRIE